MKQKLRKCGQNVVIYPYAKIVKPEVIEIGHHTRIDDFAFIYGGKGIKLGRYNHVASFTSIIGGGTLITGDYVGLACGSRIVTGTDHYEGGKRICPFVPEEHRNLKLGTVILEKDVFIGTNAVVHPDVRIGEGAIVGSCSLVLKDIEPWTINVGIPCKPIGKRPKVTVPDV